ncbi:16 kDa heat shock protein A [Moritella viscosa]|uniref:16 kDa heat shock protein A n=1 Tax=Moritella viscosa TaxID=80854 RepID=A0A090ICE1_9GAMM|nr:Hsp20 family protein [Moritella viscosa]CED59546.1 small heat shock protein [Moritella viscosa]SGY88374.1 16 kDa heat shock protein A [Moritella viscosa]SGY88495.1 16 kDa heat shock protein A [Moritella viscosa]SGY90379.1 16 kDa heat shock protein A [Moritella viscosa]SHO01173.1 16 kDa heat shock protein A [Moritella viscosa]
MTTTTTFDFAPLYRHAVGFDRFANMAQKLVEQQLASQRMLDTCKAKKSMDKNKKVNSGQAKNQAVKTLVDTNYPRYNITHIGELDYQITLALAGFSLEEIDITVTADELVVTGKKQPVEATSTLLHQGINQADFSRKFALADHVHVLGAEMAQGLLTINLQRQVPEALQPRKVAIGS